MKIVLGIVGALSAVTGGTTAHSQSSLKLTCVGSGGSEGNDGLRAISETAYRVEGAGQQISIREGDREFCVPGSTCTVEVSGEEVRVNVRDVPHHDPGYSAAFRLDRKQLIFKASGGGLDGGWSITGKCTVERS